MLRRRIAALLEQQHDTHSHTLACPFFFLSQIRRCAGEACSTSSSSGLTRRRRVVIRVSSDGTAAAAANSLTPKIETSPADGEKQSPASAPATIDSPHHRREPRLASLSLLSRPVTELTRMTEADLNAMWGTVGAAIVSQTASVSATATSENEMMFPAFLSGGGSSSSSDVLLSAEDADSLREKELTALNSQDRLCGVVLMANSSTSLFDHHTLSEIRNQVVNEVMENRRLKRMERETEWQARLQRQRAAKERRAMHARQRQESQRAASTAFYADTRPSAFGYRRHEDQEIGGEQIHQEHQEKGGGSLSAFEAQELQSQQQQPQRASVARQLPKFPPPVVNNRPFVLPPSPASVFAISRRDQQHEQEQYSEDVPAAPPTAASSSLSAAASSKTGGFPPHKRWTQPTFQPASSFTTFQPRPKQKQQQRHHHEREPTAGGFRGAAVNVPPPPLRRDPLDVLLDSVASSSLPPSGVSAAAQEGKSSSLRGGGTVSGSRSKRASSGAIRRSSASAFLASELQSHDASSGGWSVIPPQDESARRFSSSGSSGFRRIDAPRATSASNGSRSRVVLNTAQKSSSASSPSFYSSLQTSSPSSTTSPSSSAHSLARTTPSILSAPTGTKRALAPPQRRERYDETACLSLVVERIFAGLSRDSTVPVSKCVSFLFDSSASDAEEHAAAPSAAAAAPSGANVAVAPPAEITLGEICDHFNKRIQDVPAAVRREVRNRLQRNHGGLLKFVEQKLPHRFALQKHAVSSELIIAISATAAQQAEKSKFLQQQLQKQTRQLPAWAWNATNNTVTSFNLPATTDGGGEANTATSSCVARPWNQQAIRHSVEQLRFGKRAPLSSNEVLAMMDMFAAGGKPIYGSEDWSFSVSLTGPRVWRASEVAEAFVDHVPTFWVKEKHLAIALTNALPDLLGEMQLDVEQLFERYSPQVFELNWGEPEQGGGNGNDASMPSSNSSREQQQHKTVPFFLRKNRDVRLSPFFVHPRRGAADPKWQLRASEHALEESQYAQDRRFAEVLLENLPEDGLFVHLPTWINSCLAPRDFAVINSAPPKRVLTVLHQYSSLFYIRGDLPPRIQCVTEHFDRKKKLLGDEEQQQQHQDQASRSKNVGEEQQQQQQATATTDLWIRRRPTHLAPRCIDEHDAETSPAPALAQFLLETLIDHEDRVFAALSASSSNDAAVSSSTNGGSGVFSPRNHHKLAAAAAAAAAVDAADRELAEQVIRLPLPEHAPKITDGTGGDDEQEEVAAGALCNETEGDATGVNVVECVVSKLPQQGRGASSGSSSSSSASASSLAVWVPIAHIYRLLTRQHKDLLKPHSLAKFLRMHGRIFCVSPDLQRVVLHRWDGASQAFATVDTLLAEEENAMNSLSSPLASSASSGGVASSAITPRTRKQLQHLAPDHPLLDPLKLLQAIVDALPEDASVKVRDVFHMLPREARAALPTRQPYRLLLSAPHMLTVWKAHGPDGRQRHLMVQRAELGPPPSGCAIHDCATREEIVAHLQELLVRVQCSSGRTNGDNHDAVVDQHAFITLAKLHALLRWDCVVGVRQHFGGSLEAALKAYPQLFVLERCSSNTSSVNLTRVYLRK